MFKKILIANRGEIACRIIKTAKKMGVGTVAVYTAQDANSLFVQQAGEAYQLPGILPSESYLNISRIVEAAKEMGVAAIHPGYGFLSENAHFARALADAHITFIGPSVEALEAMGDKQRAKNIAREAGIPLLPSFYSENAAEEAWVLEAQKIGFPVLVKPVGGGGGKGMHLVDNEGMLAGAIAIAKREAKAAFGDSRILLEKYLPHPRHIEVQIFGDKHGNLVHLFERNCSIQRRHQKILEGSPANLPETIRENIFEAAIRCGKAIGYLGAGTVEFLVDKHFQFYFMEMNTRLQVEHPVTEMITGLDLVEWQILVAAGEPIPLTQKEITHKGHAIEARIYAENPQENFLPSGGTLLYLKMPSSTAHLRLDSGITKGDTIEVFYDPLLAKLIAWGKTRREAIRALSAGLNHCEILGFETNLFFLQSVLHHKDYQSENFHTKWVEENLTEIMASRSSHSLLCVWAAFAHLLTINTRPSFRIEPDSPWGTLLGWTSIGRPRKQWLKLWNKARTQMVGIEFLENKQFRFSVENEHFLTSGHFSDETHFKIQVDQKSYEITAIKQENTWRLFYRGEQTVFEVAKGESAYPSDELHALMTAPMSARVVAILTAPGRSVKKGEKLVLLEAMKMEHALVAPFDAIVKSICCMEGGLVEEGMMLVEFEE